MEGDGTELILENETEKSSLVSTPRSLFMDLKPSKIDECDNNQTNQQGTLSPITVTKISAQESHRSSDIKVTLENESVWSRFHSLGTEMILTKQGRRMFPCCRFRLNGLDPQRKYFLVMDILPLDNFTHKWNGKTWEPVAMDVPHVPCVLGQICVHPDSPAFGQQWMDNPVSFYKVKLTSESIDQEGCVLLRPMHRYQPRLHIVPVDPDSEMTIVLNSPNVKMFTFPQTEFYAVTSYQNPQITRLKIDCNPFAMAFREDSQSINILQNKLKFCSSVGTRFQSPLLHFARNLSGKWKEGAINSSASTSVQDNRVKRLYPRTASLKEGEGIFAKMRNDILSCPNNLDLCHENTDYSQSDRGHESFVNESPAEPVLDEHVAPLNFDTSVTVSSGEHLLSTETVPPISSTENQKSTEISEEDVSSQISCTNNDSPTFSPMADQSPQTQGEIKFAALSPSSPPFFNGSKIHERNRGCPLRIGNCQRSRKPKAKRWTHVKHPKPHSAVVPSEVSLQPDLEDVEGMLFVSFVAKEALNVHGENIKESEASLLPPSSSHDQSDNVEPEDVRLTVEERIVGLEKILLLHLKQLRHRQVIHPCLQDVGMKLSLLDPKLPIDLNYLGVHLPPASPVYESLDKMNSVSLSSSPAELFVSRTGKTNNPTKIKGWRDKFKTSAVKSAPEGLKNSSAFCSEMLDAYLENEAQQISDRVAVFSKCSAPPVSYQLPSKSSSYVVTLDSLLQTRSTSSNKVHSKQTDNILPKSPKSTSTAVSLTSAGFQRRVQRNRKKGNQFSNSFQARQHSVTTVQASKSMSSISSPGMKIQPCKSQPRWNKNGGTTRGSSVYRPIISVKAKNQMMLKDMEEEAILNGKVHTHITTNRAKFALTSLLNFEKPSKRPSFLIHHKNEDACPEHFCRLGCICDSLAREIRGPTHCRRVECMFDCNCFKHKLLILHHPKKTHVQRGRKRSMLAFSILDPEREPRPPPAPSITTLRKTTAEDHDPEPLFTPAQIPSKPVSCSHSGVTHSTCQVREEDKGPVYLYFESMMTCARVREYNSNPPPQIHMFPARKRMEEREELSEIAEEAELLSSQKTPETNLTETQIKPGEPKPTKLLEILSECNWEPHRRMVLNAIFRRMNSNLMSEPFCFGMYKIQLLSTTTKEVNRSFTITYKVCISRVDEKEMTDGLPPPVKKATRNQSLNGFENKVSKTNETQVQNAKPTTDLEKKSSNLVEQQQNNPLHKRPLWDLPLIHDAVGCLQANKKKPGSLRQGLIKVNGKSYSQAKVLLGQLGSLHPVNRIAAFVTGRLQLVRQDQNKIGSDATKACPPNVLLKPSSVPKVAYVSNQTPSNLPVARSLLPNVPEPKNASENKSSNTSSLNASLNLVGPPPGRPLNVPDGSRFVLLPLPPLNSAAPPSAETVTSSILPPGQQVVLHPASGMPGSNFLCQYNGQMIQLKPIKPLPLVQLQPRPISDDSTSQVMQTANTTSLPKDTGSLQTPLNSTPLTEMLRNPSPMIEPKGLSLSAKSGMNIANGMPAFNLQSSFPGKTGTLSFRIYPPTGERKPVGSEHSSKTLESSGNSSSPLILPGGFTLIKLFQSAVPAVPTNVSHPAQIPQNGEGVKKSSSQSCSSSLKENGQISERIIKPLLPQTSNCISAQQVTAGSSQSSSDFPSEDVNKDEPVKDFSEIVNTVTPDKHDWVPEGAAMLHSSVSELEPSDMDDWPPNGVERILWIDSADENENEDLKKELNKDLDFALECPTAKEASESKTTPTGTVKAASPSSDDCLQADKQNFNERQLPSTHENGLSPGEDGCTKSSHADKQKQHLKSNMPKNDPVEACDAFVNAADSITANISKHKTPFSVHISSPNITEKVIIQENCHSVKNESHDESTDTDMTGNEPYIENQGLPETSTLRISKIETWNNPVGESVRPDHFGFAKTDSVSFKIESCSDVPKVNTCYIHSEDLNQHTDYTNILPLINKEESSMNQIMTTFSNDPTLGSENSSQIFSHVFHNKSTEPTTTSLQSEDKIADNAPCSLLDGQTCVMNTLAAEHVLNTAFLDQKTDLKSVSPFPHGIHQQDLKEGNEGAENRNKQLMSKAALGEVCDVEEITVDVMKLSESEDELSSVRFDKDEDDDDGKGDTYSDEDDSSNASCSDSETTSDTDDASSDGDVDIESFERILNSLKNEIGHLKNAKRSAKLRKKIRHLSNIISSARYLPKHELQKRENHSKKERVRRNEMRQAFIALKEALNVEEGVSMCRHDILNQARIMISALEDRSKCLEERKKALFQQQVAYINKIVELSEKPKARENANFKKISKHQKCFGLQKTLQTSVLGPPVNPRRLDSDGNRLPPRFGSWKAPNYIRKRSRKVLQQPSLTPTEKQLLQKIVLQSFVKTDAVKLTHDVKTSLPGSTVVSSSADLLKGDHLDVQAQSEGMEKCVSNEIKKTQVPEHVKKESPTPSSAVSDGNVQKRSFSESEMEKPASEAVKKLKKRGKIDVVIEEALSNPDILGPRQLRQRSPAVSVEATIGHSANKRRKII